MVYQVNVVLKNVGSRVSWDRIAEALARDLVLDDIVVEKSGILRCKYIFPGNMEEEDLADLARRTILEIAREEELKENSLAISARLLTGEDLEKLRPETAGLLKDKRWFPGEQLGNERRKDRLPHEPSPEPPEEPEGPPAPAAAPDPPERKKTLAEISEELASIREELLKRVRGQRHAVNELTQGVFEGELFAKFDAERKSPVSTFLFMGPSGVGKTFLARQFAELSGRPVLLVDMSEYSDNLANLKFNGDHGENAVVTGFVVKHPNAILIFDEIEKAHINTIHLFLQILDSGQLMDQRLQKEVSFRDTTIIMTTNVGSALYDNAGVRELSGIPRSALINALRSEKKQGAFDRVNAFPDSITTRMASGHIVMFNHLEPYALMEIVRDEITRQLALFREATGIRVAFDPVRVPTLIMYAGGGAADARSLRGLARNTVVREIQDAVIQYKTALGRSVDELKEIWMTVDVPGPENEIYALFHQTKGMQASVFAEEARDLEDAKKPYLELHVTADAEKLKKQLRGITDFVLLDPFLGCRETDRMPSDLEDIRSDGMAMFEYLREYYPEVPIYLLDTGKHGTADFSTLLSRGARDVLTQNGAPAALEASLEEISLNAVIGNSIYQLGRAGKYLSFNCAQYSPARESVEISFADLRMKTAVNGEDYASVARNSEAAGVSFDDVVGCRTAKEALMEVCETLDDPRRGILAGKTIPKGILLYGPPGTGKTMLARAMAKRSNAMFLPTTATSFFEGIVGRTEEHIRELFKKARRYAPAVIFIDEVDAVARRRTGGISTAHNEDALNALLSEMDGFTVDEKRPVFVLAATNYDVEGDGNRVLDPAFVRRFDRRLHIPLPDTDDRAELFSRSLAKHGVRFPENHEAAVRNMAERSAGMCSADIEKVVELYARNLKDDAPSGAAFMDALDEYRFGDVKDRDEASLRQTAYHEAGHALVSWVCGVKPLFMTIVSRSDYGGYMETSGEDRGTRTFSEIKDIVCRCLAGRAAELEVFGETAGNNTGAVSDLQKARYLVRACLTDYGMGDALFKSDHEQQGEELMQAQLARARAIAAENRAVLDELVDVLVKEKSLDREAIDDFFSRHVRAAGAEA